MEINPIILSIPIYFILIGVELLVQQFQKIKSYRLNDAVANISCGITDQLVHVFIKIFTLAVYQLVFQYFALFTIPQGLLTLVILFVASDFCYYWAHRMSHEVNLFWLAHVVHHQSEDYNLSVALRQGALQAMFGIIFYLPLAVIGFDTFSFVLASSFVTLYQFWIHTESIKKLGWFETIFNTPSHHRVHHGKDPKYVDRNYAGVFIIWDKLLGTFQPEEERPTYGITTPLNTWNPLEAHITPFRLIFQYMKKVRGFDKIRLLFKPPGWLPEYAGGFQAPKEIDKNSYRKYDTSVHFALGIYVLAHYVLTLTGTALFLFNHHSFDLTMKLIGTAFIMISIINFGTIFEQKRWAYYSELIRLIVFPFVILYFTYHTSVYKELFVATTLVSLISCVSLILLRRLYFTGAQTIRSYVSAAIKAVIG